MIEWHIIAAIVLMIIGVIGSFTPMMPGALLSVAGILVYWYGTGYTRPGIFFLIAFILTGLFAVATDYLSGVIAGKVGGASTKSSVAAGLVGLILFFVLGPLGILIGVAGTIFLREFLRTDDMRKSFKAAAYSTAGVLGSTVVQFIVTLSLLIAFVVALII